MHELSIVESLLTVALEHAERAEATRFLKVYVVVGDLSGVVEESMDFYFSFLTENTIAAGARLVFTHSPARLRCRKCDTVFSAGEFDLHCPNCQEQEVDIVAGRELYIETIEVE